MLFREEPIDPIDTSEPQLSIEIAHTQMTVLDACQDGTTQWRSLLPIEMCREQTLVLGESKISSRANKLYV
jgi:hypothetical protein